MTKGKILAILIHCAGVAVAMAICLGVMNALAGSVSSGVLTGATVFYCATVAWVTVRVLRGQDRLANSAAAFMDEK